MSFIPNNYPIFEANQVLTNRHLNDLFNYLDGQNRLTRTHLIGIGIVCGWEVDFGSNVIEISEGVGVTSEGHVIKTDALTLTHHKIFAEQGQPYDYKPFQKNPQPNSAQEDKTLLEGIVELTTATDVSKQGTIDANLLKDKALVLFLELRNEGLRNCSPNNCDDKGSEKKATIKALLVPKDFQDHYLKALGLRLPQASKVDFSDLKLPRIDVPRTGLADSQQVLRAFAKAIGEIEQIDKRGVLSQVFGQQKGVLSRDLLFIQNLYDHFDDLIQAINEYQRKARKQACACCPDSAWFPQHLILGTFNNDGTQFGEEDRQVFMASPAVSDCEKIEKEVAQLRRRINLLIRSFNIDLPVKQIRITPSKMGVPLSKKAIPYYYEDFERVGRNWNFKKTTQGKQNQLLGYHAPDQADTAYFAKAPLKYGLEPYDFLRIEGHLGQNYQEALQQLLELKTQNRLPIDVIALRAGSFDESIKIDFSKEKCHFEDLEAVYDAFREELRCSLGKTILKLGSIPIPDGILAVVPVVVAPPAEITTRPSVRSFATGFSERITSKVTPQTFFQTFDNDFVPAEKTLGAFMQSTPQIFKDITETQEKAIDKRLFPTLNIGELIANPIFSVPALRTSLSFIDQLTTIINLLTNDLPDLDWERFQKEHEALKKLRPTTDTDDLKEISEQLTSVITACRLEGLRSIIEEFRRRLKHVKQKQYLSYFLQKHPGIQHKAGVSMGGTFILVYHQDPEPDRNTGGRLGGLVAANPNIRFNDFVREQMSVSPAAEPSITIGDRVFALPKEVLQQFERVASVINTEEGAISPKDKLDVHLEKTIAEAVQRLPDGTVIADFFLPYLCTSNCAPVQFVLPKTKPTFTFKIVSCPDPQNHGFATVHLKPQGGTPDYEVSLNDGLYQSLTPLTLGGTNIVKIRDADGTESLPKTIAIPAEISVDLSDFEWDDRTTKQTYTQTVVIKGGVAPFTIKFNNIVLKDQSNILEIKGLKNGEAYQITIADSNPDTGGCTFVQENFVRACKEPCGGLKTRSHYMLPVRIQQSRNKIAVNITSLEVDGEVLVRDKSQDFTPLIKVQDFLKAQLNVKRELWEIVAFKIFNDTNDKPQLLGMQIEQFRCQEFKLEMELVENESTWRLIYTRDGVDVFEKSPRNPDGNKFAIPSFELQHADLCAADPSFKFVKSEDFKIGYSKERKSAISIPEDAVDTWYWEKNTGEKNNDPKATFDTAGNDARVSQLLIGFTKRGGIQIETIIT